MRPHEKIILGLVIFAVVLLVGPLIVMLDVACISEIHRMIRHW